MDFPWNPSCSAAQDLQDHIRGQSAGTEVLLSCTRQNMKHFVNYFQPILQRIQHKDIKCSKWWTFFKYTLIVDLMPVTRSTNVFTGAKTDCESWNAEKTFEASTGKKCILVTGVVSWLSMKGWFLKILSCQFVIFCFLLQIQLLDLYLLPRGKTGTIKTIKATIKQQHRVRHPIRDKNHTYMTFCHLSLWLFVFLLYWLL